jgi:hypothetical protein
MRWRRVGEPDHRADHGGPGDAGIACDHAAADGRRHTAA